MKKSFLFLAFSFLLIGNSYAQETNKTLVKTLNSEGASVIDLQFKNNGITAEPWDEGTIRIELEITANFPEAVVSQLIKAGRYTLSSKVEDGKLIITADNLEKTVSVGGKDLEDEVKVLAKTPGYYAVADGQIKKPLDAAVVAEVLENARSTKSASATIKEMSLIQEKVVLSYRFIYVQADTKTDVTETLTTQALDKTSLSPANDTKATAGKKLPSLNETQKLYGEILISGEPIEYDLDDE